MSHPETHTFGCAGDCASCGDRPAAPQHAMTGVRFAASSLLVFLLPLLCAIAPAVILRGSPAKQLVGALAGWAVGAGLAGLVFRLARPRHSGEQEQ